MSGSNIFAVMAEQAYSSKPYERVDDYEYQPTMSNERVKIYTNGPSLVMAIRGTKPTNAHDLVSDLHVFKNSLTQDRTYNAVKQQLEYLLSQKIMRKIILTGHSLGGSMVIELMLQFPNEISEAYVFNPGYGYRKLISDIGKKLKCLVLSFTRECKELKMISKKLHVYTTGKDPISILSFGSYGNQHVVKPNGFNPHSISNFTKVKVRSPELVPPAQVEADILESVEPESVLQDDYARKPGEGFDVEVAA